MFRRKFGGRERLEGSEWRDSEQLMETLGEVNGWTQRQFKTFCHVACSLLPQVNAVASESFPWDRRWRFLWKKHQAGISHKGGSELLGLQGRDRAWFIQKKRRLKVTLLTSACACHAFPSRLSPGRSIRLQANIGLGSGSSLCIILELPSSLP